MNEKDLAKSLFDQEMMRVSKDELKEAAQGIHDIYLSFQEVGFTKMEALTLVSTILKREAGGSKQ